MTRDVFHLGPNFLFDEGSVAIRSGHCPVQQHEKDKPEKYRVDLLIMEDVTHYFINCLDVHQGKNKANIDFIPKVRSLPTIQKVAANAIIKSQIANDKDGSIRVFVDNRHASPQLFAIMLAK